MATFFQNLVASTGGPCSFDAAASLTSLAGATSNVQSTYSDVDDAMVPDNKKLQMPYGDSGLFDVMGLWGPEGCRYPYFGFMPDAPLCNECSSMAQAKEDVLNGLWDGPCNDDDPPGDDDSLPLPPNYPGCGCDCADFLRRDISAQCTPTSCIHVAQQYAPANSVCAGSDVKWDTVSGCTDEYGTGTQFDSTWSGDACLDSTGATTVVQDASATCYQTQASNDEAALTDKKSNIGQCAFNLDCPGGSFFNLETCEDCDALDGDCADCECRDFDQVVEANCKAACAVSAAAATGPAISAVLALVGAVALRP